MISLSINRLTRQEQEDANETLIKNKLKETGGLAMIALSKRPYWEIAVLLWLLLDPYPTTAQSNMELSIGLSVHRFSIIPKDNVFPDASKHNIKPIGGQLTNAFVINKTVAILIGIDAYLGQMKRQFPYYEDEKDPYFGLQIGVGPQLRLGTTPVFFHLKAGVNMIKIMGKESESRYIRTPRWPAWPINTYPGSRDRYS